MVLVGAFLALIVTVVFMFVLRPVAAEVGLVDVPGGRKRHGERVPVIGGLAMGIGLAFGLSLAEHPEFWSPIMLGIYLLVTVGIIDDRFDLPASVRLIAQTCACLLVVFAADLTIARLGSPLFFEVWLGPLAPLFTILVVLTVINAFNIVDGIDGLAGGLAFLSLLAMAIIGIGTDVFVLTTLLSSVVGGFLLFNLPLGFNRPVRAFMGDAGSTSLGLAIACVGIALSQGQAPRMSPVIGLWLVAVPLYDLFSAIMRRVVERKSPFAPDHDHLHHVLMRNGLSSQRTLCFMLMLAVVFGSFGIFGDVAGVSDETMLLSWLSGGVIYYHIMRRPRRVIQAINGLHSLGKRAKAQSA